MKAVRVNEAEFLRIMVTVFEEVSKEYRSDECGRCATMLCNLAHKKLFSPPKARQETTERARQILREIITGQ